MRSAMHQRSAVEARRKTGAGAHGFRRLDGSNVGSATPDRKPPRLRDGVAVELGAGAGVLHAQRRS
jgi:hypothetical protein